MSIRPAFSFTSGIYRPSQPPEHTALGCTIPLSVSSRIGTRNGAEIVNPPPYGRTALEASVKRFGTRTKLVALLFSLTTLLGCGALDARSPSAQTSTGVVANSAIVDFGS